MDELTLFLSTRNDALTPSTEALTAGRAALLNRASEERSAASPAARKRRLLPRLTWAAAGLTAAMGGVFVAGSVGLGAQSAQASELLQTTAAQTAQYTDLVPGAGEYLLSSTHARWSTCGTTGTEETPGEPVCTPNDQFIDVYMPADPTGLWVLDRDWGNAPIPDGIPEGPIRAENAAFYGPTSSWSLVDYSEIPLRELPPTSGSTASTRVVQPRATKTTLSASLTSSGLASFPHRSAQPCSMRWLSSRGSPPPRTWRTLTVSPASRSGAMNPCGSVTARKSSSIRATASSSANEPSQGWLSSVGDPTTKRS